jgi:hypothetical protein
MTTRTVEDPSPATLTGQGRPELIDAALKSLAELTAQATAARANPSAASTAARPPQDEPIPHGPPEPARAAAEGKRNKRPEQFLPREPESFREAGLNDNLVESLALKFLMSHGDATGREVADQLKLPFLLIDELLRGLKNDRLIGHRGGAAMNDFVYQLSDVGRERAKRYWNHCTYFGSAPVSLDEYVASVKAQSLTGQQTTVKHLRHAFDDLSINDRLLDRLGPAVNSGRGLFLFGAAGNGKTSIAERVTKAFGQEIWIPRAIGVDGEIMRVYDPVGHEELPLEACDGVYDNRKIDRRWVRVRRPTIVVGGELTMSALEVSMNGSTGICEAPLQVKGNCGTLVIDDFGRQRVPVQELLNRWIVPLERRHDFLNMPNGRKIEVPFDLLIIFSTNLEPRDLVDEAFLRRIPFKIEVADPTIDEFKTLFLALATKMGFPERPAALEHLISKHYLAKKRPFRYCHPRDLLLQVRSYCSYKDCPLEITDAYLDMAVENYFSVM